MLEKFELLDCLFLAAIVWFPFMIHAPIGKHAKRYRKCQPKVPCSLPSVVVLLFEMVFFGLVTAAGILHYLYLPSVGTAIGLYDQLIVCFFVINVFLAHAWGIAYFRLRKTGVSFLVAFLAWATAVIVLAFYGVQAFDGVFPWTPFILYIFYVAWLTYLFIMNLVWMFCAPKCHKKCKCKHACPGYGDDGTMTANFSSTASVTHGSAVCYNTTQ